MGRSKDTTIVISGAKQITELITEYAITNFTTNVDYPRKV